MKTIYFLNLLGLLTQEQVNWLKDQLRAAANAIGGPDGFLLMDSVALVLISFDSAHLNNLPGVVLPSYSEFVSTLISVLDRIKSSQYSDTRRAWFDKIVVAAQGALNGWLIMRIMVDLGGWQSNDPNDKFIDIVAWRNVTVRETGQTIRVVAFLKVDSRTWTSDMIPGENAYIPAFSKFIETLKAIATHIALSWNAYELYGPGFYIIGVIFTRSQDGEIMNRLADEVASRLSSSYPVFLSYKDKATGRRTVIIICPAGGCPPGTLEAAGEAACGFGIPLAFMTGNITYICDNGREVDIIWKKMK